MKIKSSLLTGACVAALVFAAPFSASAQLKTASASPSPAASPAAEKMPRAIPFRGTATSVDHSAKTFAVSGKESSRTFKATDKTTVTKDGKTATFADLANDNKVTGSYWKQTDGTLELKSLKIGANAAAASETKTEKAASSPAPSASPKKKK
jgi:hypothetical protein